MKEWLKVKHFAFVLFLISVSASAEMRVVRVVDARVLVSMERETVTAGDQFLVLDSDGKKSAVIQARTIRQDKWVGEIIKGTVEPGNLLMPVKTQGLIQKSALFWGGGLLFYNTKIVATPSKGNEIKMAGSNAGAELLVDWDFYAPHRVRMAVGYLPVEATGSFERAICNNSTDCALKINYLASRVHGQFFLGRAAFIGGGLGFFTPLKKSSNIFEESEIGSTTTFEVSAGMDIRMSHDLRLSLGLVYLTYPSSGAISFQQTSMSLQFLAPF